MTASSPVTMEDLVDGLIILDENEFNYRVTLREENYVLTDGGDSFNTVSISSDGLTITFGGDLPGGPTFTGFTFNA